MLRRRLARREQLMRARTRAKNEVHAVLMRQLVGRPPFADLFGVKGRQWLGQLELAVEEAETVEACMRHIEFLDSELAEVERLIARYALSCSDARRLMSVPGVNVICAATFLAAIGDIRRFKTSRQLVGYLGLDPKVHQSGSSPAKGGPISKQGSLGAGRGGVQRRAPARTAARVLSASARPPRSRDRGRRRRPQAHRAVLVPTDPRGTVRPPAAVADRQKAALVLFPGVR